MSVPQRWERPFNFPPGYWKRQLAGKYLDVAARGDVVALNRLLTDHPDYLNKRGSHNRTLLWEATRRGKLEAVKWLLERGAELDTTGCYNSESHVQISPYCAAIYYDRVDVADYLRLHNPQLDIFRAAFLGDQARVEAALTADPALVDALDPYDDIYFMPLIAFAVASRQAALTAFLLKRGAVVTPYSALLLYLAARDHGRMDLIDLLMRYGADVSAVDGGIFVHVSNMQIMAFLLQHGASAKRPGKNRFPPLVYLARGDKAERPDKIRMLLEYGAPVDAVDSNGKTALHHAAAAGHVQVMTVLLDFGADTRLKDYQGQTALSLALTAGKTAAASLLMERGATY